jgi:hypothetical protein
MERRPIQVLDPHCRFTDIGTAAGAPSLARLIVLPQPKKAGSSDTTESLSSNVQVEPECGIDPAQPGREDLRQQKWADGRELFAFKKYAARPLDNIEPERGQQDPAFGAVDKRGLKDFFQFLYAGAQGRLRNMVRFRRPPKVAVIGEHFLRRSALADVEPARGICADRPRRLRAAH